MRGLVTTCARSMEKRVLIFVAIFLLDCNFGTRVKKIALASVLFRSIAVV